jgi:hypothetical protein
MSELEHYDQEIYALDERIGRLAQICGADLSRTEVVVALIKGRYDFCARSDALAKVKREELRGLLMLKYRIEASCIDAIGVEECGRMIVEQDERVLRRGFAPQNLPDSSSH